MRQELPATALEAVLEHSKAGRESWKAGNIDNAESHFLKTWGAIPDPKLEHDYAQSLAMGLVVFFRDTGQHAKARQWLDVAREAYGPGPNVEVEFLAGTVHYEAGEFDTAFEIFDDLFARFGKRPFEGEDKRYLSFYKKRAAGN